jgi:sulfur-oxidizing protein SoxZ
MATKTIKINTSLKDDGTTHVKSLIKHKMDTGFIKDKATGKIIPAHFIEEVTCKHNGKVVMNAHWGRGVSRNPFFSFKINGAKSGDSITVSWVDNTKDSDTATAKIK